jgi:hypothetical protein
VFLGPLFDELCGFFEVVGVRGVELEVGGQLQEHLTNHVSGGLHGRKQFFVHLPGEKGKKIIKSINQQPAVLLSLTPSQNTIQNLF